MAEQKDEQDAFPSFVSNEIEQQEHVTTLSPFKEEEAEIKADFITPSTIEYGPPKEIGKMNILVGLTL
jgi:hypothetical protein